MTRFETGGEDVVEGLSHPVTLMGPCILLLVGERPGHGYELMERLIDFGFSESGTTQVYRELRRLEDGGLLQSYWEAAPGRGPARRVYELTERGRVTLVGCIDGARLLTGTLDGFASRAEAVTSSRRASVAIRRRPRRRF